MFVCVIIKDVTSFGLNSINKEIENYHNRGNTKKIYFPFPHKSFQEVNKYEVLLLQGGGASFTRSQIA